MGTKALAEALKENMTLTHLNLKSMIEINW